MSKLKALPVIMMFSASIIPQTGYTHDVPIGDGNISNSPQQGFLYSCQTSFNPNAGGASKTGDWFDEASGTYDPDLKPTVDGAVEWPSEINVSVSGDKRIIIGNGLPDHATGNFPVSRSDDAYEYDRNPGTISPYNVLLTFDVNPKIAAEPSCVPMGMIGFALSGAALFNALDGRGDDAAAHEIMDLCSGHPQQQGQYHYHDLSDCLVDTNSGPNGHSDLLGYALDGFGIYGINEVAGVTLTSADLDACHGHTGEVIWDGKLTEIYHYHYSEDYPYTVGCFVGDINASAQSASATPQNGGTGPGAAPGNGRGPGGGGDPLRIVAQELGVSFEQLRQLAGSPPPSIRRIAQQLNLSETKVRAAFQKARASSNR